MTPKRVVVIASGETERRALPRLLSHLRGQGIALREVLVPPRHMALTVDMAEKLIKAAWYANPSEPPAKFVVLLDVDRSTPEDIVGPIRRALPGRLSGIGADVLVAYAQQHLEAWYFGDSRNLRAYLRRALGSVDASVPDGIEDPKRHLMGLLAERSYTARTSEEIAATLDASTISGRSPSFRRFVEAVRNGTATG